MIAHLLIASCVVVVMIVYGETRYERGYHRGVEERARFEKAMRELESRTSVANTRAAAYRFISSLERANRG